jgi:parvulin-like peptidyl-prolyl isomerase
VRDKVREEFLYREALAMGLDQDDTIIKRRLAQKLEFLSEDIAAIREPTPAELEAWFARNAAQFASPARVTFRHVYFAPDKRGTHAEADARAALARLSQGEATANSVGDPFFDRDYYPERTPTELAALFGTEFAKTLAALPTGSWQGPIESGLGWHLVRIESVTPKHVPTFAEVDREAVKAAWIDAQRAEAKRKTFDTIRAKYDVVLPVASAS